MENEKNYRSRNIISIILVVGVVLLGVLAILRDGIVNPNQERFAVQAQGKVFAKPDIANINFSVQTEKQAEAQDAVQQGAEDMNNVISTLKDLGVEEKDIKTTSYSLRPVYIYVEPAKIVSEVEGLIYDPISKEKVLSGYELSQTISLKIRDLDMIGTIIEKAVAAGANQSGGITFTIDDTEELQAQARAEAIINAKAKAKEISKESGLKLGKIINVSEYQVSNPVFRNDFAYADEAMSLKSTASIPDIESGEMEVTVNVNLTYKVK